LNSSLKRLLFVAVLVFGVLVTAEGVLRLVSASSRTANAVLAAEPIRAAVRDSELGWRGNPEFPEHDRLGFRNPVVPTDVDLVAMGDSQTYGSRVHPDEAWPRLYESMGGGLAYNMGLPGWGPPQALLALDEALALEPELVVEAVYFGNDLVDAFRFVYEGKQLRDLRSPDPGLKRAINESDDAHPFDGDLLANQDDDGLARRHRGNPDSLGEYLSGNLKLFALGGAVRRAVEQQRHPVQASSQADSLDTQDKQGSFLLAAGDIRTVLTPGYREQAVDSQDPRIAEGLRITVDVLERMRNQSTVAGVGFAVLLIPTKELALQEVVHRAMPSAPPAYDRLVVEETALRSALLEQLRSRGIPAVDTLGPLSSMAQRGELPYSETEDGHLNRIGHRVVAETLRAAMEAGQTRR
jgi:hypothetical protein